MKYLYQLLICFLVAAAATAQPANDDCANAIALTVSSNSTCTALPGSNAGVQSEDYDPCREFSKRNVWYKFTATATTHVVRVTYGTMTQGIVDIYGGACGSLSNVEACNESAAGPVNETVVSGLVVGQEYKIAVSTREESEEGSFDICIYTPTAPANDECTTAVTLTVNNSNVPVASTSGSTLFATQSLSGCTGTADDDVWFRFTATGSSHRLFLFYTNSFFTVEAFSGNCGALVSIACASPGGNVRSVSLNSLVAGETYFVRVYSESSNASSQGSFSIAVTSPPANDECTNAINVVPAANGNDICVNPVAGSTYDATQSSADCFGGAATSNDTWFRFTATQAVHKIKVFGFNSNSIRFQVMRDGCASPVSLFCALPLFVNDTAQTTIGGLTTGDTYLVRVYSGNSGGIEELFNICISSPVFPPNDECANAIALTATANTTINYVAGTNAGATNVSLPTSCNSTGLDVWYKFTAVSQTQMVKATSSSGQPIVMELFEGNCATLVHLRCSNFNDSLFGLGNLTIGQTYFIRLYFNSNTIDNFQVAVFTPQVPANDECATAINIIPAADATCDEISGSNIGATQSINDNCDGNFLIGNIRDVWYRFTATSSSHRIRLIRGTGSFMRFKLYSGACSSLSAIACSGQLTSSTIGAGLEQRFNGLTVGATYFIRVFNTGADEAGTFDLCVKTVVVPANNECSNPTILTPQADIRLATFTTNTTVDATQSAQANGCVSGIDDDVWYQFTATQSTMQVFLQNGSIGTTAMGVYSGSCGALTLVRCQSGNTRDNVMVLTGLTIGANYLVRVYSTSTTASQGSFSIMVTTQYSPPANDDCINATLLTPSPNSTSNYIKGSTIDAGTSGNTSCVSGNDVWYRFVATSATHRVNVEGIVNVPTVTVFSGNCGALVAVPSTCSAGSTQVSVTASSLTIGSTYFIKVLANSPNSFSQSTFKIAVVTPQAPANDECVGAIAVAVTSDAASNPGLLTSTNLATFSNQFNCAVNSNDVWFRFVANGQSTTVEVETLSNNNAIIELFTGSCGALVPVRCNGPSASQLTNVVTAGNLVAGNTYFIRVGASSTASPLEFRLKVYTTPSQKLNARIDSTCLLNNLVANPGLETDFGIQTSFIPAANPGTEFIPAWRVPTRGTSDFFNALNSPGSAVELPSNLCFGNQSPRNGIGYAGLFAYSSASNYREYLEGQLSAPMTPGKRYLVSMYVNLSDYSTVAIDQLGIALRTARTAELTFSNLSVTAAVESPAGQFLSDKENWVNVSGIVTADQPYQYLVIGNFKTNAATDTLRMNDSSGVLTGGTFPGCASTSQSAYYYIDDVVVAEINESAGAQCALSSVPLNLVSFTGKKSGNKSLLQWKTVNEVNTSHFDVERSTNGVQYSKIGTVAAENTNGTHQYSLLDASPVKGVNYYRLGMTDIDGRSTLSAVVKVSFENKLSVSVSNPFNDYAILHLPDEFIGATVDVYTTDGKLLLTLKAHQSVTRIDGSRWPTGVYVLRITKHNEVITQKLIKK